LLLLLVPPVLPVLPVLSEAEASEAEASPVVVSLVEAYFSLLRLSGCIRKFSTTKPAVKFLTPLGIISNNTKISK
jgi:hypothetical protein